MRHYRFHRFARHATHDPERFVADIHDLIDRVMEHAVDAAVYFADWLPWNAEEITRHVDDFVSRSVPRAERCFEDAWDDAR
jgi:hypothetical protein